MKKLLLVALMAFALVGCSKKAAQLDYTNKEKLVASIEAVAKERGAKAEDIKAYVDGVKKSLEAIKETDAAKLTEALKNAVKQADFDAKFPAKKEEAKKDEAKKEEAKK